MKLGLMSLGDRIVDPVTGTQFSAAERHRMIVEAAVLAEDAGFSSVNIGEHHGIDYVFSAPPFILAAIGERTKRIRLSTAVTLAANLDPFRIAEDYATVDLLSGGRVEIAAGRGNFFKQTTSRKIRISRACWPSAPSSPTSSLARRQPMNIRRRCTPTASTSDVASHRPQAGSRASSSKKAASTMPEPPTSEAVLNGLWSLHDEPLGGLTRPSTFIRE